MDKPILCNQILSGLTQPKKALALYSGGSIADSMIRQTQVDLLQSQKFVVSENLVNNAYKASTEKPSVLLEMVENAQIPFDNLWIEWDERSRQSFIKEFTNKRGQDYNFDSRGVPERVGYHIKKFTDETGHVDFLYEMWAFIEKDKAEDFTEQADFLADKFIQPSMCFTINNNKSINFEEELERVDTLDEFPKEWRAKSSDQLMERAFHTGAKLLSSWYLFENMPKHLLKKHTRYSNNKKNGQIVFDSNNLPDTLAYDKDHEFNCLKEIYSRISMAQSRGMHWSIPSWKFQEGYSRDEIQDHEHNLTVMCEGDLRFLISLFALINQDVSDIQNIVPDNKIIHTKLGKRVPRNEYKVLSLNISDRKVKKLYKDTFIGKGNPKRLHTRRGHFRHLRNMHGEIVKKVWIKSCVAGNAELGTIEKDYNLKSE